MSNEVGVGGGVQMDHVELSGSGGFKWTMSNEVGVGGSNGPCRM